MGVPHSAQNFAVGARLALQFVQCFCIWLPHSGQNFDPTATGLWQLPQAVMAGAPAAAICGSGAAGAGAAWAACAA